MNNINKKKENNMQQSIYVCNAGATQQQKSETEKSKCSTAAAVMDF